MNITCPYCFHVMQDTDVHFRSEKVNHGECDLLPDDYDDIEDFIARYNGPDKESILQKYQDWAFFAEGEDPLYEEFWAKFNGTTEYNPADEFLKVKAYRRKVIDPRLSEHCKYLKPQAPGDYFIRDNQGMVTQIELITGDVCNRRVCPRCHNPLPDSYGRNKVKFATVIGITGAGKTVYLSQLLKMMTNYAVKAGLSAIVSNPGARMFLQRNTISAAVPLPGSTPAVQLQQPLFYDMVRDAKEHGRVTETFVLYDVAGEVFHDSVLVEKFAPFVKHSDGVIVLIDPMQFGVISGVANQGNTLDVPATVLDAVQHIFTNGDPNQKCPIPFAVCISKADMQVVQQVFSDDLRGMLLDDVHGIKDTNGFYLPIFNASEYNPILNELYQFIQANEIVLAQQMQTNYSSYAYFAFTALGCSIGVFKKFREDEYEKLRRKSEISGQNPPPRYVRLDDDSFPDALFERTIQGELSTYQCPIGPVLPKRVEEPLLWLFHKLGYIGVDVPIDDPTRPKIPCPREGCGSLDTEELPPDQQEMVVGRLLFRRTIHVNRVCKVCGHRWEHI